MTSTTKTNFLFRGEIPASKSMLNRLLIVRSFAPTLAVRGDSNADDVVKMRAALHEVLAGRPGDCGAAGTTLRFLALRASRLVGRHELRGTERLFSRPQTELVRLLEQLGCQVKLNASSLIIESKGWQPAGQAVEIDRSQSSQFASALILSAWDLPFALTVRFRGDEVSDGYLQMTISQVQQAGMQLETPSNGIRIPAHARISTTALAAEPDLSSAFAVAALAVLAGKSVEFSAWPVQSLQPDSCFVDILTRMGCRTEVGGHRLQIHPTARLSAVDVDLKNSPDLFPVLSVVCAFAHGRSRLHGAVHLAHKESSRIEKSSELLSLIGARHANRVDGMEIEGPLVASRAPITFDPDHDHRLAMMAAVANAAGCQIQILRPEVVAKSFPEFWTIAERTQS